MHKVIFIKAETFKRERLENLNSARREREREINWFYLLICASDGHNGWMELVWSEAKTQELPSYPLRVLLYGVEAQRPKQSSLLSWAISRELVWK